jgi:EcoEI R protein C-terminal
MGESVRAPRITPGEGDGGRTKVLLTYEDIKALADSLHAPPHLMDESTLWQAYAALDKSKVKGASRQRILADLVSLVRFAMHQDNELVPYPERVAAISRPGSLSGGVFTPSPPGRGRG